MRKKKEIIIEKLKTLQKELKHKHRFVIIDSDTFREKWSFQLSASNLFVSVGISMIVLVILTTLLIAFTPLREYIPGYMQTALVEKAYKSTSVVDSLEQVLRGQEMMLNNIKQVIVGEEIEDMEIPHTDASKLKPVTYERSHSDSMLRKEIESHDRYQVVEKRKPGSTNERPSSFDFANQVLGSPRTYTERSFPDAHSLPDYLFFSPLKGKVVSTFEAKKNHYGIDIAGSENALIKAAYNGTVLFSNFTVETGYVIAIQHPNNIITVYKHNSALLKHIGDVVRAGEPIAFIGNSGELTTGPHLHFELWYNGKPVDPMEYINF